MVDPRLRNIHILVVEDDSMMRKLLREMLKVVGFSQITTVQDGFKALEILRAETVDMVITDWRMAGMDGLTLTYKVRAATDVDRFMPVLMLTGKGERADVEAARDAGITEYLIKPFAAESLFTRITRIIDEPRKFVLATSYKGPDRRRKLRRPPDGMMKRRTDGD
jgi:two-component system chemotaxis response regulator CheY